MSDANNEQLRPPPSWDKFEEICADLFSRIWKDNQLVRYGRAGQRQHGVDIYGKDSGATATARLGLPRGNAAQKHTMRADPDGWEPRGAL